MTLSHAKHHDGLRRLVQAGSDAGVQLVRITGLEEGNRYTARPIEFDADGETQFASDGELTVLNLAEPADEPGGVPAGAEAVALDVEGRWIVFVRTASAVFPARIVSAVGGAAYTVREQRPTGAGTFEDVPGAAEVDACNLAERTLGPGGAVDAGAIVLVLAAADTGQPATLRYYFDHPAYAKYLD